MSVSEKSRQSASGHEQSLARGVQAVSIGTPDPESLSRSLWQGYVLTTYKPISEKVIVFPCVFVDASVQFCVLFGQSNIKSLRDYVQYVGTCAMPVAGNVHADEIRDADES